MPPGTPREPLSRDRVLHAAVRIADEAGLAALSMRRIAKDLGVEAMSLYHHVTDKTDLLGGTVDLVVSTMTTPTPGPDWHAQLRAAALSAHHVLRRHPWAAELLPSGPLPGPARLRHMNALLACLHHAGFTPAVTDHAYHALESHIIGFSLWETGIANRIAAHPDPAADVLSRLSADEHPHLIEHIRHHQGPARLDDTDSFTFGLDLILDGLRRTLDDSHQATRP